MKTNVHHNRGPIGVMGIGRRVPPQMDINYGLSDRNCMKEVGNLSEEL